MCVCVCFVNLRTSRLEYEINSIKKVLFPLIQKHLVMVVERY